MKNAKLISLLTITNEMIIKMIMKKSKLILLLSSKHILLEIHSTEMKHDLSSFFILLFYENTFEYKYKCINIYISLISSSQSVNPDRTSRN